MRQNALFVFVSGFASFSQLFRTFASDSSLAIGNLGMQEDAKWTNCKYKFYSEPVNTVNGRQCRIGFFFSQMQPLSEP